MDRGVIAAARELLVARQFPGVIAVCSDALDDEPECTELLLIRARAHVALRRDLDAQADLRDVIRIDPGCGLAYRLLGELAARRDENESAAIFFREAVRLDPNDDEAADWLLVVLIHHQRESGWRAAPARQPSSTNDPPIRSAVVRAPTCAPRANRAQRRSE